MPFQQQRRGCGRGVLALSSREPLRRPRHLSKAVQNHNAPHPPLAIHGPNPRLLVKYNYKSNPDQPGGFPELTVKQGQKVTFLNVHPQIDLWWNVKDDTGESGYVPGSYVMVIEEKPSALPWLENRRLEEQAQTKKDPTKPFGNAPTAVWKPYVSAYGGSTTTSSDNSLKQYYCEVCDKQLNGPKPYQAHMVSKAHKEELEAQGLS